MKPEDLEVIVLSSNEKEERLVFAQSLKEKEIYFLKSFKDKKEAYEYCYTLKIELDRAETLEELKIEGCLDPSLYFE